MSILGIIDMSSINKTGVLFKVRIDRKVEMMLLMHVGMIEIQLGRLEFRSLHVIAMKKVKR